MWEERRFMVRRRGAVSFWNVVIDVGPCVWLVRRRALFGEADSISNSTADVWVEFLVRKNRGHHVVKVSILGLDFSNDLERSGRVCTLAAPNGRLWSSTAVVHVKEGLHRKSLLKELSISDQGRCLWFGKQASASKEPVSDMLNGYVRCPSVVICMESCLVMSCCQQARGNSCLLSRKILSIKEVTRQIWHLIIRRVGRGRVVSARSKACRLNRRVQVPTIQYASRRNDKQCMI